MRKNISYIVMLLAATLGLAACDNDTTKEKDMQKPVITDTGITANPIDCQRYKRGDIIPFRYVFTDNQALGTYNINVHNDFDHHTHSGTSKECELDPNKDAVNPWIFNQDYTIPAGSKSFEARQDIKIPKDIDPGDYHFMIRLTDAVGHQELKPITIHIEP